MPYGPLTERLQHHVDAFSHDLAPFAAWLQRPSAQRRASAPHDNRQHQAAFAHLSRQLQQTAEALLHLTQTLEAEMTPPSAALQQPVPAPATMCPTPAALLAGYPGQVEIEPLIARRRPIGFTLLGRDQPVETWRDLYLQVLLLLAEYDPVTFRRLPYHPHFLTRNGRHDFAVDAQSLQTPLAVAPGVFAEGRRAPAQLLFRIGLLLDSFLLPREAFLVSLGPTR